MKENYFKSLTGLRFIAASMVYFHHFNTLSNNEFILGVINEFHVGVSIFFVLSGFLISYRYGNKEINYKKYFINRFARIYPVFFLFTILTYLINQTGSSLELFLNFTLLKGFFTDFKFSGIPQAWTLTVEECFYSFALLLFLLKKNKKYYWIIMTPFILVLIGLVFQRIFSVINFHSFLNTIDLVVNYTFFGRSFEFIAGFILGSFILKLNFKFKYFTYTGLLFILFSSVVLYFLRGDEVSGIRTFEGKLFNNYFLPIFGVLPLIYGLVKEKTLFSQILETKIIEDLGKSSYAFYIIHLGIVTNFIHKYFTESVFLTYLILLILSFVIFKFYEEPINKKIKKISTT